MKRIIVTITSVIAFACVPPPNGDVSGVLGVDVSEIEETSSMALTFQHAADESGVPVDVRERFVPATGVVEFDGADEPYGLFALGGDRLERASSLSGLTVEEARTDVRAGVFAGAALLSRIADDVGMTDEERTDPLAWEPALRRWQELDEDLAEVFAEDVLSLVRGGAAVPLSDGTTMVIGRYGDAEIIGSQTQGLGASNVLWRPSPNHSSRGRHSAQMVIIHTCEGAYSGCVSWLRQTRSGVSAHYVVKEDGSEVSQLVDENRKAWHISATYVPSRNAGRLSHLSGVGSNNFTVGIEHGGRGSQPSWNQGLIDRSVQLVRDITSNHNIPRDRYHVVGHGQLQPYNRSDPGPNWPWASYLAAIAGGPTQMPPPPPPPGNNNPPPPPPPPASGANVATVDNLTAGRFRASGSWELSSWASGRVGANYRFRPPAETSDLAEFRVAVPDAGTWEVFTRVPGNGYNSNAPYFVHHKNGRSVVHRDISNRGGSWVSLGTYEFDQVDDWIVQQSCWTGGRGYLIADAVRIERR